LYWLEWREITTWALFGSATSSTISCCCCCCWWWWWWWRRWRWRWWWRRQWWWGWWWSSSTAAFLSSTRVLSFLRNADDLDVSVPPCIPPFSRRDTFSSFHLTAMYGGLAAVAAPATISIHSILAMLSSGVAIMIGFVPRHLGPVTVCSAATDV